MALKRYKPTRVDRPCFCGDCLACDLRRLGEAETAREAAPRREEPPTDEQRSHARSEAERRAEIARRAVLP